MSSMDDFYMLKAQHEALMDSLKAENSRKVQKDASVVGRSLVGGIVAGPVGAIIGGLSAVNKNNRKKK